MLRNSQVNLYGSAVNDPTLVADDYSSAPFVWLYSILNFLELSYVVLQGTSNPFKSRQKNMYKIIHTYLLFRVRVIFYVKKKITEQPKKTWKHLCRIVSTYLYMCILNFIYVHIYPPDFWKTVYLWTSCRISQDTVFNFFNYKEFEQVSPWKCKKKDLFTFFRWKR